MLNQMDSESDLDLISFKTFEVSFHHREHFNNDVKFVFLAFALRVAMIAALIQHAYACVTYTTTSGRI